MGVVEEFARRMSFTPKAVDVEAVDVDGVSVHHLGRCEVHVQVQAQAWRVDLVTRVWATAGGSVEPLATRDLPFGTDDEAVLAEAVHQVVARARLVLASTALTDRSQMARLTEVLVRELRAGASGIGVEPEHLAAIRELRRAHGVSTDALVGLVAQGIGQDRALGLVDRALHGDPQDDNRLVEDLMDRSVGSVDGLRAAAARMGDLVTQVDQAQADRDQAIRACRAAGLPIEVLMAATGLGRARVNQIITAGKASS